MPAVTSALDAARLQTSFASAAFSPTRAAIFGKPAPINAPAPSPTPIAVAAPAAGFTLERAEAEGEISPAVIAAGALAVLGVVGLVVYKLKRKRR